MPRRVEDIRPGDRRSIRDIPLKEAKEEKKPPVSKKTEEKPASNTKKSDVTEIQVNKISSQPRRMPMTPPAPKKRSRGGGKWILVTLALLIVIIGAGYFASSYYSKATFTILPKTVSVKVNGTYVASASPAAGALGYEFLTLKGTASSSVPAQDGTQTTSKAQGKVTVFNSYSAQAVRLIAGTRIANDSGKIYRLNSSIVIPGYKKQGSSVVPGTVSATVSADQAGAEYNISKSDSISDFKIVAYKGTDKYESVYARIASDITGGYIGVKKTVDAKIMASSTAALKQSLISILLEKARANIPDGYIMYDSGYISSFTSPVIGGDEKGKADVTLNGTVYAFIFKEDSLVSKLAGDQASIFGSFKYDAPGLNELAMTITNTKDFSPEKKTSLIVHLNGPLKLIGSVPVQEIKAKLAGMSLSETTDVFKSYGPVIESGSGELVPPWSKVPTDPDRIVVKIEED